MHNYSSETREIALKLRPIDDAFFRVIGEDVEVCQEILRTLTDDCKLEVIKSEPQVTKVGLHREVRLDVLCRLSGGSLANIEVQKTNCNDDVRRTRFHSSIITVNNTDKGSDFSDIPNVIVIYISEYNVLCNGQRITEVKRCQKLGECYVPVNDGETIIFANTVFSMDEMDSDIAQMCDRDRLLMLFKRSDPFEDIKFPSFSRRVRYYKEEGKGLDAMCSIIEEFADKRYEGAIKAAEERVKEANRKAEEAQNRAEEAQNRAEEAQNRAEEAQNRAEEAQTKVEKLENNVEEAIKNSIRIKKLSMEDIAKMFNMDVAYIEAVRMKMSDNEEII